MTNKPKKPPSLESPTGGTHLSSAPHTPADFEELMSVVQRAIRDAVHLEGDVRTDLDRVEEIFENCLRKAIDRGIDLPPSIPATVRKELAVFRQLSQETVVTEVHPVLLYLLWRNYEHLKRSHGAGRARELIAEALQGVTRRPRGRPRRTPLAEVAEARRLQKQGQSYADIGKTTHRTRDEVRHAMRHAYRDKKLR